MPNTILLRGVLETDLPIFFEQQRQPQANQMAAFPARDRDAFMAHWEKILRNNADMVKTVLFNGEIAGNIVSWEQSGHRNIGYWLGMEYWGKGVATQALNLFLRIVDQRPLHAHAAKHNCASVRVLEKCGFRVSGENELPDAPYCDIEELLLILEK